MLISLHYLLKGDMKFFFFFLWKDIHFLNKEVNLPYGLSKKSWLEAIPDLGSLQIKESKSEDVRLTP